MVPQGTGSFVLIPLRETILFGLSFLQPVSGGLQVLIPLRETILFGLVYDTSLPEWKTSLNPS